ncbi:MAG: CorA family divalent cation transporter [Candidatus Aenigmatarchaeota archaeon]|nr:hypothetical protein [Candidatus Aenigmarchaeota archaeon]
MLKWLYKFSESNFGSGTGTRYPKPTKGFIWIHATAPTVAELSKIRKDFGLADKIFEHFPHEHRSTRYTFRPLTFTIVNYCMVNGRIALENILYVVGKNFLLTITKVQLPHFDEIFSDVVAMLRKMPLNVGYVLYHIMDSDSEETYDVLAVNERRITELEKSVLTPEQGGKKITAIVTYKRELLMMWRRFWSSSKIIYSIKKGITPIAMNEELIRLFDDVHDTYIHQMEIVSAQRDTLTDALTIYESVLSNKLATISNRINLTIKRLTYIMFVWTAIATILSIPNTVATIFGIPQWPLTVSVWQIIALVLLVSAIVPLAWFYLYWKKFKLEA